MRAGLGMLRLAPRDFWAMTPRELTAALDGTMGRTAAPAPTRAELDRLIELHPDR